MAAVESLQPPPRLPVGPLAWLRQNLFNTWYNSLLTFVTIWLLYKLIVPVAEWAFTEARWGVIEANLTLFMVGQYPREQLWRVWIAIFLLGGLLGLSWGAWKAAARGFAFIGLGAGVGFALICLLLGSSLWLNWLGFEALLLICYGLSNRLKHSVPIAQVGFLIYFPIAFLLLAGSSLVPGLSPVEMGLWGGLLLTVALAVVGNLGALPLGILLALGRRSKLPIVRSFSIGYIELFRGVPLITVLYMADILLPLFLPVDVRPDRVIRAMVGFVLFEAAYQAENVRGGLQSIGRGQYEAAQALGLNAPLATLLIILPQALRAVIPALFNSFISLFKDTSLVAIIGLFDILRISRSILAQTDWLGTHREVFLFAFLLYWGFNLAFSYGNRRVEEALGLGKR
jgi:general L-amino acid transport system permease protein